MSSFLAEVLKIFLTEFFFAVRSQSIDNTVTSDCDSGFDNGDGLSRSDISLNLSFSKSTCSIASSSSHGNHPRSASCQDSSSGASRRCFFPEKPHSSSELSLFSPKTPFVLSSASSNTNDSRTVDPSVLAAIEVNVWNILWIFYCKIF